MAIDFKGSDKPREIIPPGTYPAVLYSIVELGTMDGEYMGKPTSKRKIRLTWELPSETREFDGVEKPLVVGKTYTASLFEQSRLRPIVEGMLGGLTDEEEETFDIKSLLGKTCLVQIVAGEYNGNKYADLIGASQLVKGMPEPKPFNPQVYFDYAEFDQEVYDGLPNWMKEKMAESQEMKARNGGVSPEKATSADDDINPEDIPF
jgi:hypothetical protein